MFFKKHKTEERKIPTHIAIIMDGNGRWAKKRGLPRSAGHAQGSKNFKTIARYCNKIGVKYLTVYAFSTENWRRPKEEVDALMNIFRDYLKDTKNFLDENISLQFLGSEKGMPEDILELMHKAEEDSKNATGLHCNMCINYGGRDEIVNAVNKINQDLISGKISGEITEELISSYMYSVGQPDPDLIIRPSGEYRISNFLLWQSAYTEYVIMDVLWPDFREVDFRKALESYAKRDRRYGKVK